MSSCELVPEKIEAGSAVLLKLLDNDRLTKSKKLLACAAPIFLQIDFVKIPKVKRRTIRIPLKHNLLTESSDVCLIVADLIRGRRVNHVVTINHYKKLFEKRGIFDAQKVKQNLFFYCDYRKVLIVMLLIRFQLHIMSSRQIRVDYAQYEARRKLCKMFDVFLIDEKISNYLRPKLGKEFPKARKVPIPIRMRRKKLKEEIISKLMKTSFVLDGNGITKTVQVGHVNMSASQIMENIICVNKYIKEHFPGGWDNIRSLHIKGLRSVSVPIYMSLIPRNSVPAPILNVKRKRNVIATQEISIVGTKVSVYRSGRFRIHKRPAGYNKEIEKVKDFEPQVKRQKVNSSDSSKDKIGDSGSETKNEEIGCDGSATHGKKKQKKPKTYKAPAVVKETKHKISTKGNKNEKILSKKIKNKKHVKNENNEKTVLPNDEKDLKEQIRKKNLSRMFNNKERTKCQSPCENNEKTILTNIRIAQKEENNETKVAKKSKMKRPIHNQSFKEKEKKKIFDLKKKKKRKLEEKSKVIEPKIVDISNDTEIKQLHKLKKKRTICSNTDPSKSDSPRILNKDKFTNIYKKKQNKKKMNK